MVMVMYDPDSMSGGHVDSSHMRFAQGNDIGKINN